MNRYFDTSNLSEITILPNVDESKLKDIISFE